MILEAYRENGEVHRTPIEEYTDAEAAREQATEMNAIYERLRVRDHWVEVVER